MANELQLKLKEGDIAPPFTAATNGGGRVSLSDYKGKNMILYFYPGIIRRVAPRRPARFGITGTNSRRKVRSFWA